MGGGRAPRHRAGRAGTQPGPARGARGPGANLLHLHLHLHLWVQRVLVVRNAWRAVRCGSKSDVYMPPVGDTDGAGGSEEAGEAPHSVAVLPVIRASRSKTCPFLLFIYLQCPAVDGQLER